MPFQQKENNYTDSGAKALLDILRSRKNTTLKEVILDCNLSSFPT